MDNFLRFVRNIVLVRLLSPEAFGLMATLIAAVAATEAFAEVGLKQSVIQNKRGAEDDFLNVIWWLSAARAFGLYFIAFVAAPWIADFFGRPQAANMLRIGFLVIVLNGLVSPRLHVLEKELRYGNWVILAQASSLAAIGVSVIAAFLLRNAWALVVGYLAEAFLKSLLSHIFYRFRPRLCFSKSCAHEVQGFSRGIFGLPVLMMLFVQADTLVVGKVLSVGMLGMYAMAKDLSDLPNKVFSKVSPLFLPAFSMVQDDLTSLRHAVLTLTGSMVTLVAPLFVFFILFAKPLLSFVYGPNYAEVASSFQVLCIYALLFVSSSITMNAYIALGRPGTQRTAAAVRTGLFMLLIYPAVKVFGLLGAPIAMLTSMVAALSTQLVYARRLLKIRVRDYVAEWLPGIGLSALVAVSSVIVSFFTEPGWVRNWIGLAMCMMAWSYALVKAGPVRRLLQRVRRSMGRKLPVNEAP